MWDSVSGPPRTRLPSNIAVRSLPRNGRSPFREFSLEKMGNVGVAGAAEFRAE
jgi:hypothetical protein